MNEADAIMREAIRYTAALYNENGDQGRYDEHVKVFLPGAIMVLQNREPFRGISAIIDGLRDGAKARNAFDGGNFQRHHITTSFIKRRDENNAVAKHYLIVTSEIGFDHTGFYDDEYRLSGEQWLIAKRVARIEWAHPLSRFEKWLGSNALTG